MVRDEERRVWYTIKRYDEPMQDIGYLQAIYLCSYRSTKRTNHTNLMYCRYFHMLGKQMSDAAAGETNGRGAARPYNRASYAIYETRNSNDGQ